MLSKQLKNFGQRSGQQVTALSIGAMRLPKDTDKAIMLLRRAIDRGLCYIDTSRGYGESELVVGRALKDGYRDKVILSTKWSPWITKIDENDDSSSDCTRRRLEESMLRLDVDYLDYYQVWNINSREAYDRAVARDGMVDGIKKARDEGLVGHIGFTTHDSVENLLTYLDENDWCEIILTTYNMLNTTYAPVIAAAHTKGIGTVTMNPVAGGRLSESSPVLEALAKRVGATSVADMAIRYVLSNPDIDTILNGLSKLSDIDNSINAVSGGVFSPEQLAVIDKSLTEIKGKVSAFCTSCKYCLPCPAGIDIPAVMTAIQDERYWGWGKTAQARYDNISGNKADVCTKCGKCEKVCTQNLQISEEMSYAVKTFGGKTL
jgi:predicted aldo/keto reductase-like oxidoreductase